jgi:hypothetical protein
MKGKRYEKGEWMSETYFENWPTDVPVVLLLTKDEVAAKIAEESNRHGA